MSKNQAKFDKDFKAETGKVYEELVSKLALRTLNNRIQQKQKLNRRTPEEK